MFTLEDEKAALLGNFDFLKILGNKNTHVKVRKLYIDSDLKKHNQIIDYYNDLIGTGTYPAYALLQSILCQKNVCAIKLNNDVLKISLKNDEYQLDKNQTISVLLTSPNIKENKDAIMDITYRNYDDSRYQFLYESSNNDNAYYLFNTKSLVSSYEKNADSYVFKLNDSNSSKYYDYERKFLTNSIEYLLNQYNETCYVNYSAVIVPNTGVNYYVRNLEIEIGDAKIKIDLLDDNEFNDIMNKIYVCNNKINEKIKRKKEKR